MEVSVLHFVAVAKAGWTNKSTRRKGIADISVFVRMTYALGLTGTGAA